MMPISLACVCSMCNDGDDDDVWMNEIFRLCVFVRRAEEHFSCCKCIDYPYDKNVSAALLSLDHFSAVLQSDIHPMRLLLLVPS